MSKIGIRRFGLRLFAALFPFLLIIGVIFLPRMLNHKVSLNPLTFQVDGQSETGEGSWVLSGHFDRDIPEHEALWLYAENAMVKLQVGQYEFTCNTREETPSVFRSPGSSWFRYDSPGISAKTGVKLSVSSYYGENGKAADKLLGHLWTGDGSGLYQLIMGKLGFFSLVQMIALIAGILYLTEGAIDVATGMIQDGIRIGLFGFYCVSGGLWCVADTFYPYLSLIFSPAWMAAILDISGQLLFPIALAAMIRYYIRGTRTGLLMSLAVAVEVITAVLCLGIQLSGTADLAELKLLMGVAGVGSICIALVCIIADLWRYRDTYLLILVFTVLPVLICFAADGLNMLYPFMNGRYLMGYCYGISILLLLFQLASYAKAESAKAERFQKMEHELEESRISIMLSQIQPHFLYNSLLGIKQLCCTEPGMASDALEHFAYYLRGNLHSISDSRLIPFEKEMGHVRDYLYLEKMRFGDKVEIQWEIGCVDFYIPSLTLQPIVENAVRHGITKKRKGGTVIIRSEKKEDGVFITVSDDGVGFDMNAPLEGKRPHIGIENVKKRLGMQCGGSLMISSSPGRGTKVVMKLPLIRRPGDQV